MGDLFRWEDLRFLNPDAPVVKSRRDLPHWEQAGKTFFVTFRLGDSLPQDVLREWREERSRWLIEHPRPWCGTTEAEYHRIFSSAIDRYLDEGMGDCILREPRHAMTTADAFRYFDGKRYTLHAFVVMPNHVHLLASLSPESSMVDLVASWKRFSAREIRKAAGGSGPLWMKDHFDRLIRDWDHFMNVCRYIRNNPRKAGLEEGEFLLYESVWIERLLS